MRRVAAAVGIDYDQWHALVGASLKLDFRVGAFGHGTSHRALTRFLRFLSQAIFYTAYGIFLSFVLWQAEDLFFAGTVAMTYIIFIVGTIVLLDHNSALTSPNDYLILGFRPVSSRTYFAARLANVLAYTTALTTLVAYIPIVVLFIVHGPGVGIAGAIAFYACSIGTALAILFVYAWLLRVVGPDRLKHALSYLQMTLSFVIYGGIFLLQRFGRTSELASITLPKTAAVMLFPATWFATYLEIGAGRLTLAEILPALASILALAAMVAGLGGRLSFEYSERLGAITAARSASAARAARRPGLWFRSGEARAAALLIGSQFRNDQKFRMSVLSILPLTILYVLMGVSDDEGHNPLTGGSGGSNFSLVNVAVMIFPSMLNLALTRSDAFRASWIFFASPADRVRVIRASKNVLVVFFLVPYLLFIAAIYAYLIPEPMQVTVHVMLLGLLSHLMLQVVVLIDPALPFSRPNQPMRGSSSFLFFLLVMGVMSGLTQVLASALYSSPGATLAAFSAIAATSFLVDGLTHARVERQTRSLEFLG